MQRFFPQPTPVSEPYSLRDIPPPIAVVIPVCDEYPGLYETLKSLAVQARSFRVICVVNNTKDAADTVKESNRACLEMLRGGDRAFPPCAVPVEVIDCASAGRELPDGQGVGLARKIGADYALASGAGVIACLDADTLVSENYASELSRFCASAAQARGGIAAAVTDFTHQRGAAPAEESAVRLYESFLKEHSRRLKQCGSWYYPVALGPTIVCSSAAYAACGGMNTRTAGEDFYFLQALIKVCAALKSADGTSEAVPMLGCTVFPSARISLRVPFGTGRKVSELSAYGSAVMPVPIEISGYPDFVYEQIDRCIKIVTAACAEFRPEIRSGSALRVQLEAAPSVCAFLESENFFSVWEKLCRNNKTAHTLERAFQCWFDGLKIIRLIHYLMR